MKKIYKKYFNIFKNNNFFRSITFLSVSTIIAQVISMIALPIITRLFTAQQYGILTVFSSIIITFGLFRSYSYEFTIPILKNENEVNISVLLNMIILIFNSIVLTILLILFGNNILQFLNSSSLEQYILFIPLGTFATGLINIYTQWQYRYQNFKILSISKIIKPLVENFVVIILGLLGLGLLSLLVGRVVGLISTSIFLGYLLFPILSLLFKERIKFASMKNILIKYKNFALFTTPRRFFDDLSNSLPVIFISVIYSTTIAGLYGLAISITQIPVTFISSSIGNVYYSESAALRYKNPSKILTLSYKLLKILSLLAILPTAILVLFGPILFGFVFGTSWSEAGVFSGILSIGLYFKFVFKPISNIFEVFEKQKLNFLLSISKLILLLITFGVVYYFKMDVYKYLWIYCTINIFSFITSYLFAIKIIKNESTKRAFA